MSGPPAPHDPGPAPAARPIPVWDLAVRVLHAALAILVVFDLVRDDGDLLHRQIGYAACAVVLLRLVWSLTSRGPARLAALRPSLRGTLDYLRTLARGHVPRPAGHDPLGLWMVWLLWTLVLLLGVTGWMTRLDAFWGDDGLHDLHAALADLLLAAVVLHLAGVAVMSALRRELLPAAMLTGAKRVDPAPPPGDGRH